MLERARQWARGLKRDVMTIWIATRDLRTPFGAKIIVTVVAAYALSLIDLLPDLIPIVGYLDDLLLVPFGILIAIRVIPPALMAVLRERAFERESKPMLIAALAYCYARRNARNERFTVGTGKIGDLAGFASAVVLALIALLIGWESLMRFYSPVAISFRQAIFVAVIGLIVNLICAWLLREDHAHHPHAHSHEHSHSHGHDHHSNSHGHHHEHATDNNLRAANLHVLADALTSMLAIAALTLGSLYGWNWLDPMMGIVGAAVTARWFWG